MKEKIRGSLPDLLAILIGNLFLALTVVLFVLPGELISCGTTGLSLLAKALWGIPVSAFVLVFNMVMLILGWAVLGRKFAMTTIASSFLNPIFLELFQRLFAGQVITRNLLLCAVFGGLGLGISLGLVIRAGASTGGMDIPPLILKKFLGIPVPVSLWVFDFVIMLMQLMFHTPEELLYGIVMLLAVNFTLNKTLVAGRGRTEVKIISEQALQIRDSILNDAERWVTVRQGEGGYRHKSTQVVLSVVSTKDLHRLKRLVRDIDPGCFMIVTQVTEVLGRGFSLSRDFQTE